MAIMSKRDYYDVLGVEKGADDKAIKSAFRKLAMANHPDRNQGDSAAENHFREANEAYDILKDLKNARLMIVWDMPHLNSRVAVAAVLVLAVLVLAVFQIFSIRCFPNSGGGGGRQRNGGGNDLRYDMSISLEDAFSGLQQDISITVPSECDSCSGTGAANGSKPSTCGTWGCWTCVLSKDFLPLSGLATPVKAWGR